MEDYSSHLINKYKEIELSEQRWESIQVEDAEVILVSYGISSRVCTEAVEVARSQGIKLGLIRAITLWPFPVKAFDEITSSCTALMTVEMNILGQMVDDVLLATKNRYTVYSYASVKEVPETDLVIKKVKEILSGGETGICADIGFISGINFPDFTEETLTKLKEQLPFYASPSNPLNTTASLSYDADLYAGALRTVMSGENIGNAYKEILSNVRIHKPKAKINGILMQKMMPKGMEVIIGVNNDAQFGPMVLVGLGGVFVEVFEDVALYPAPLNREEAFKIIRELKVYV